MIKKGLTIILVILSFSVFSQTNENELSAPKIIPGWTFYLPGGAYFFQGKVVEGSIFAALEMSGIYLGISYDKKLRNNSSSPYYNYPLFLGLQAFQTEKLAMFRNQLEVIKYYNPDFQYDELSEKELFLAPFKPKNFLTPITFGMVAVAAIFLGIEKHTETQSIRDVDQMYFLGRFIPKDHALGAFGLTSMAMSWSAGVGEEYICRNWMMPLLDYKYGQKKGLIFSSAIFGGLHLGNLLFAQEPDYKAALIQVAEATIAGFFLGRDVQKRDYNIGPAVAAHTWYDFTLMLGSFLINPKNNFLGVNVKFKM